MSRDPDFFDIFVKYAIAFSLFLIASYAHDIRDEIRAVSKALLRIECTRPAPAEAA